MNPSRMLPGTRALRTFEAAGLSLIHICHHAEGKARQPLHEARRGRADRHYPHRIHALRLLVVVTGDAGRAGP